MLAAYKTKEACEILVGFLRAALEDPDKERHVFSAVRALKTATGQRWSCQLLQGICFSRHTVDGQNADGRRGVRGLEDHLAGGTALPVITRFRFGMVKMKATTDEAVIRASEP